MANYLKKYWGVFILFLFLLAVLLGLAQRKTSVQIYNYRDDAKLQQELLGFYNTANQLAPPKQTEAQVSFLAVGDIMLSRNVALEIQKSGDVDLPFGPMAEILKSTDFNFGNLESPISPPAKEGGTASGGVVGGHSLIFGAPENYTKGLVDYNFKILNLANNHAFDQGLKGLDFTLKFLDKNDIKHAGTGNSLDEAWTPAVITANGIKICFLGASYASINDSGKTRNNYIARTDDIENLKLKSASWRTKSLCDFVVISMHAGTEYTRTPNKSQVDFAHAAIDAGADMVIGSHPHWVQTIEKYCPHPSLAPPIKGGENADSLPLVGRVREGGENCANPKYIFYSLGNFIFDQEWSRETKEGLALKMTISKAVCHPERPQGVEGSLKQSNLSDSSDALGMTNNGACLEDLQGTRQPAKLDSIELLPIILENYSTPRPATADETKKILDKIGQTDTILK